MKHSVQVTILGQTYTVRSESEPEEVRRVAAFVNQRILEAQNSAHTAGSFTAVVLALLNVAGELFQLQNQQSQSEDLERRLRRLASQVEEACLESAANGQTGCRQD